MHFHKNQPKFSHLHLKNKIIVFSTLKKPLITKINGLLAFETIAVHHPTKVFTVYQ